MAKPIQWTAAPHEPINVPQAILDRMRYKFSCGQPLALRQSLCEEVIFIPGGVRLLNVLIDTSEIAQVVTFKKQWTWRDELIALYVPITIVKLAEGEL